MALWLPNGDGGAGEDAGDGGARGWGELGVRVGRWVAAVLGELGQHDQGVEHHISTTILIFILHLLGLGGSTSLRGA